MCLLKRKQTNRQTTTWQHLQKVPYRKWTQLPDLFKDALG